MSFSIRPFLIQIPPPETAGRRGMRIILFTGKGGTGKTTCAAATAYRAAARGLKTLVISTDPAHSLSDALDRQLGAEPVAVAENLFAQELDVYYSMRKYWGNLSKILSQAFRWQGMNPILAEELSALPGMEEASAFLWIEKYYEEREYDLLVIDSAPTGETLTLLTLPQATKWWVSRLFPLPKFAMKSFGSLVHATMGLPLDEGYEELDNLFTKLERIQKIFSNPDICSIRIVMNPEKMVIQEAKRVLTYLCLYGYPVDAVIVNRLLPDDHAGPFFRRYLEAQKCYLEDILESFAPMPVLKLGHLGEEVFGPDALQRIAAAIYGEGNPADVLYQGNPYRIEEEDGGYRMTLELPFLDREEMRIDQFGDELVINIRNKRHNIFLPRFLAFCRLRRHTYDGRSLSVHFSRD